MATPTLLVISDTHGDTETLALVLSWAKQQNTIGALVFTGDGAADIPIALAKTGYHPPEIHMVRGNGDGDPRLSLVETITFGDRRLLLTHGHVQAVHDGLDRLIAAAQTMEVEGVLYGHTHRPFWEEIGGRLFLNPGSLGKPRGKEGPTFATIEIPASGWFIIQYYHITEGPFGGKTIKKIDLFGSP